MKKKKRIITVLVLLFIVIIVGTIIIASKGNKEDSIIEKKEIEELEKDYRITCIKENGNDDVKQIEEVYIQKGVLITRRDNSSWRKEIPKTKTCEYYTQKTEKLNLLAGISATSNCNEYSGDATIIYTIAEMDKEQTRLNQFDFINSNKIFDSEGWKSYMKKNHYTCVES